MKELVKEIIEKIKSKNSETYTIEKLKKFCSPPFIPKEFNSTKNIDEIKDELKAFTLGCELFFRQKNEKYNGDNQEIKEVGVYQFLQATLQDEVTSIIHDKDYLKNLLELYEKDIEEFNVKMDNGSVIDRYSTVGLIRDINQDSLRVSANGNILIVADGVGGGEDGEIASQKASDTVLKYLNNRYDNKSDVAEETILEDLKNAIIEANEVVLNYAKVNSISSIGTTLSIALIYNRKLFFGHVGDSRIYRIQENQEPKLITQDHSLPEVLVRNKEIDEDEKENYKKNILVYVIGKKDLKKENLHVGCDGELNNEILFLCSDGVWDIKGIDSKFTANIEILKRFILNSIPSDNATFIRCKFDFEDTKPMVVDMVSKEKEEDKKEPIIEEKPLVNISNNVKTDNNNKEKKRRYGLIGVGLLGLVSLVLLRLPDTNNEGNTTNNTVTVNTNSSTKPIPSIVVALNTPVPSSNIIDIDKNLTDDSPLVVVNSGELNISEPLISERLLSNKENENHKTNKTVNIPKDTIKKVVVETPIQPLKQVSILKTPKIKLNADGDVLKLSNGMQIYLKKNLLTSSRDFKQASNDSNRLLCVLKNTKLIKDIDLTDELKVSSFVSKLKLTNQKNNRVYILIDIKKGCKLRTDTSKPSRVIKVQCQSKKKVTRKVVSPKIITKKIVVKKSNAVSVKIDTKSWNDADLIKVNNRLIASLKNNTITLANGKGVCLHKKNSNIWICKVPNRKVKYRNITSRLTHQNFAKSIVVNSLPDSNNVRIIITLKKGYRASKDRVNGKQVLVFKKR